MTPAFAPHAVDRKSAFARVLRAVRNWLWPSPPPSVRCDFDTLALARGGGLFRYRLRRDARPVHAFERAGLVVLGMIAGVALVGVLVMGFGGGKI